MQLVGALQFSSRPSVLAVKSLSDSARGCEVGQAGSTATKERSVIASIPIKVNSFGGEVGDEGSLISPVGSPVVAAAPFAAASTAPCRSCVSRATSALVTPRYHGGAANAIRALFSSPFLSKHHVIMLKVPISQKRPCLSLSFKSQLLCDGLVKTR